MTYITGGSLVVALLAIIFALRCYQQLWFWARQCQNGQIAIAYKGRVKLVAPLVEYLLWCNRLDSEQAANGRTLYSMGGTQVAIIRGNVSSKKAILRALKVGLHRQRKTQVPTKGVRQGTWSARDDTKTSR